MEMVSVLVCSLANIIELKVELEDDFLAGVLQAIGNPSFLSVLGSHLLINLKEAGELGLNEGTNYRPDSRSISDIDFVEGHAKGRFWCLILHGKEITANNILGSNGGVQSSQDMTCAAEGSRSPCSFLFDYIRACY